MTGIGESRTSQQGRSHDTMGFNATWSMAVGGMVVGGIFSVLGIVPATAVTLAWLSFVVAGLILVHPRRYAAASAAAAVDRRQALRRSRFARSMILESGDGLREKPT
jgi:uncharacterized membrane protein